MSSIETGEGSDKDSSRIENLNVSAEKAAKEKFQEFLAKSYNQEKISKLRTGMRLLRLPGELYVTQSTQTKQEYVPLSSDERRGNFYTDVRVTTDYLLVGAKKKERPNWAGDYIGGASFVITSGDYAKEPKKPLEEIRNELIGDKWKQLRAEFENGKMWSIKWFIADDKATTKESEEWSQKFNACWDEMQKTLEDQWELEDAQFLAKEKEAWEQYEEVSKNLKEARQAADDADNLARISRITIENIVRPDNGEIGSDTLEELGEKGIALSTYASKINTYIPTALIARKEELRNKNAAEQEKAERIKIKTEKDIEQFGVSGELLSIARALAVAAEEEMDAISARMLFERAANAGYGRGGRQADIEQALGKNISPEAQRFYNFRTASDTNAVLSAVVRILTPAPSPESKSGKSTPLTVSPEKQMRPEILRAKFQYLDKRDFRCVTDESCQSVLTLTKGEFAEYKTGKILEKECNGCNRSGEIKQ